MAQITSSGAALFRRIDGTLHFLAVESRSQRGYWGLVKGHVEEGESIAQAARREITEEVGLRGLSFLPGFREEVRYRLPSGDDKVVFYFLADAGAGEIHLQAEELADYRWLPFPAVCELFTFPEAGRVVERAARYLEANPEGGADPDSAAEHALTRPHVAALDEILGRRLDVLDDGFVRVVDYLGNDAAIVQAARVSYGEGTRRVSDDRGLIRYLMRHRHTTPFEMCELKLHVRVPMDAWRQWIRHRTASVNEISTRYSIAIDAAQATSPGEWRTQASGNRQGSGESLDRSVGERLSDAEAELQRQARKVYQERLDAGVAREQARKDLPLSTYTEAYWKIDLHNLLHFLLAAHGRPRAARDPSLCAGDRRRGGRPLVPAGLGGVPRLPAARDQSEPDRDRAGLPPGRRRRRSGRRDRALGRVAVGAQGAARPPGPQSRAGGSGGQAVRARPAGAVGEWFRG